VASRLSIGLKQRFEIIARLHELDTSQHVEPGDLPEVFLVLGFDPAQLRHDAGQTQQEHQHQPRRQAGNHRLAPTPALGFLDATDWAREDGLVAEETPQFIRQFLRRLVATARLLLQALQANGFEVGRRVWVQQPRCDHFQMQDGGHGRGSVLADERRGSREQVIEHRAERIDIAGSAHLSAPHAGLFGGHVVGRAKNLTRHGDIRLCLDLFREAEVRHVGHASGIDQDVRRFEVAMQDPLLVRVVDGLGDGFHPFGRAPRRNRCLAERLAKILPLNVVHREVVKALVFADFVDPYDVRMLQAGRGSRLGLEAEDGVLARELRRQDHLHRHGAIQADLPRPEHDAHAAARDLLEQFVVAEVGHASEVFRLPEDRRIR